MSKYDPEIEQLKAGVNCAALLERMGGGYKLDERESSRHNLKYRRGAGEIIIINHDGKGWWDPGSNAKGDVFSLAQHLDPSAPCAIPWPRSTTMKRPPDRAWVLLKSGKRLNLLDAQPATQNRLHCVEELSTLHVARPTQSRLYFKARFTQNRLPDSGLSTQSWRHTPIKN